MTAAPKQPGCLLSAPCCSLSWTFRSRHNPAAAVLLVKRCYIPLPLASSNILPPPRSAASQHETHRPKN